MAGTDSHLTLFVKVRMLGKRSVDVNLTDIYQWHYEIRRCAEE